MTKPSSRLHKTDDAFLPAGLFGKWMFLRRDSSGHDNPQSFLKSAQELSLRSFGTAVAHALAETRASISSIVRGVDILIKINVTSTVGRRRQFKFLEFSTFRQLYSVTLLTRFEHNTYVHSDMYFGTIFCVLGDDPHPGHGMVERSFLRCLLVDHCFKGCSLCSGLILQLKVSGSSCGLQHLDVQPRTKGTQHEFSTRGNRRPRINQLPSAGWSRCSLLFLLSLAGMHSPLRPPVLSLPLPPVHHGGVRQLRPRDGEGSPSLMRHSRS